MRVKNAIGFYNVDSDITYIALTRNSDAVLSGGYPALANHLDVTFNTKKRSLISYNNNTKVRQSDNLTIVSFYANKTDVTEWFFDIWRLDGATWDKIHHVNIFSSISNGLNVISITPIAVLEGDIIGFSGDDLTNSPSALSTITGTSYGKLYYQSHDDITYPDTDYNWTAQSSLNNYALSIQVYSQAPMIVGIGDSIIAGHPAHYSFIENSTTVSLLNHILAQMKILDANYVYQNMGIGSQTSTNIVARFTADVIDLKPKIALINGGVNDIAGGAISKATFLSNYTTMLDACAANNIVPVICKIIPWTEGTNTQMQTRDDWMTDLEALVGTYDGSVWVDFDTDMGEFRAGGDAGNLWNLKAIYNSGDNVHPNIAGYTKMAELINTAIKVDYIIN